MIPPLREWGQHRIAELVVNRVFSAATDAPVIILVEDLSDLPPVTQACIAALSRDLLSRTAHALSEPVPLLGLAIDLGDYNLTLY